MTRDRFKALLVTVARAEAEYRDVAALAGRLAMLGGAVAACAPMLGQLYRGEVLTAAQTLGHAAAIAGMAGVMGGRK